MDTFLKIRDLSPEDSNEYIPVSFTVEKEMAPEDTLLICSEDTEVEIGDIWFNSRTNEHISIIDKSVSGLTVIRGLGAINGGTGCPAKYFNKGDKFYRVWRKTSRKEKE